MIGNRLSIALAQLVDRFWHFIGRECDVDEISYLLYGRRTKNIALVTSDWLCDSGSATMPKAKRIQLRRRYLDCNARSASQ